MLTPIFNFLKENPIPKPYSPSLLEDIKPLDMPEPYNNQNKLAPLYIINDNYFSNLKEKYIAKKEENIENIQNLALLDRVEPVIIEHNTNEIIEEKTKSKDDEKNNLDENGF